MILILQVVPILFLLTVHVNAANNSADLTESTEMYQMAHTTEQSLICQSLHSSGNRNIQETVWIN